MAEKYEKSPVKPLSDLSPHSKYVPGGMPKSGSNVVDTGLFDNPNAPVIGHKVSKGKKSHKSPDDY